jgi:hypothetical protein
MTSDECQIGQGMKVRMAGTFIEKGTLWSS